MLIINSHSSPFFALALLLFTFCVCEIIGGSRRSLCSWSWTFKFRFHRKLWPSRPARPSISFCIIVHIIIFSLFIMIKLLQEIITKESPDLLWVLIHSNNLISHFILIGLLYFSIKIFNCLIVLFIVSLFLSHLISKRIERWFAVNRIIQNRISLSLVLITNRSSIYTRDWLWLHWYKKIFFNKIALFIVLIFWNFNEIVLYDNSIFLPH